MKRGTITQLYMRKSLTEKQTTRLMALWWSLDSQDKTVLERRNKLERAKDKESHKSQLPSCKWSQCKNWKRQKGKNKNTYTSCLLRITTKEVLIVMDVFGRLSTQMRIRMDDLRQLHKIVKTKRKKIEIL